MPDQLKTINDFKKQSVEIIDEYIKDKKTHSIVKDLVLETIDRQISEFWELGGKILSFEIKGVREVGVSVMVNYTATTRAKAFKDNEFGFFIIPLSKWPTDNKQHP